MVKKLFFFVFTSVLTTHSIFSMEKTPPPAPSKTPPQTSPRCLIMNMQGSFAETRAALLAAQAEGHWVKLIMTHNKIDALPEDFFDGISNIQALNLSHNNLKNLPPMQCLVHLLMLNLEKNEFTEFPETICSLKSLKNLNFSFNALTKIPDTIAEMQFLSILNLTCNKIADLPAGLETLSNLEELYLSNNLLTKLSDTIGNLTKLTTITLANNQLKALPESITLLPNLRSMNIADNALTPDEIDHLTPPKQQRTKILGLPKPPTPGQAGAAT